MQTINRRKAMTAIAAVPVAAALTVPAVAAPGEDAELRRLWSKYLAQFSAYCKADTAHRERREVLEAELGPVRWGGWTEFERVAEKHGYGAIYDAWNDESCKVRRIVKAIRKAKAETLFGIGVKLSVGAQDPDGVDPSDMAEAIDDARRAIARLTGDDFHRSNRGNGGVKHARAGPHLPGHA